jgi:hypothetical protein
MRKLACFVFAWSAVVGAQQTAPAPAVIHSIEPPSSGFPAEAATASVTRFSFVAYGDTRGGNASPTDGEIVHPEHNAVVDAILEKVKALAATPYPVKFVVQSGDAVLRGQNVAMWNISFSPIIERLTQGANLPFFFAVGNHDVTTMPLSDPMRQAGLSNVLTAMSRLIPSDSSPRRLKGYLTYAFAYGNFFFLMIDSNIAADPVQLSWVTGQLERLDRARFPHVIAVFHHPPFSSGPHGGDTLEPPTLAIRNLYLPLFRQHRVRMTITGHDHLFDHFVERFTSKGVTFRRDDIVTGGGGAPLYTYSAEPDLTAYQAAGAAQSLRVEHLARPEISTDANPHHFIVIQVDGDRLAIEVVASRGKAYAPYGGRAKIELNDRAS